MKILNIVCPFLLAMFPALGDSQSQVEHPPISIVVTKGHFRDRLKTETNPRIRKYCEDTLQRARENIAIARELGVRIANGFDPTSASLQGKNADEIVTATELGLTPMEAIRAATINAADLMGWQDRVGAIEPGKFADLIAVDGDPLADINLLQNVKFVMKGGAVIKDLVRR
jgi:imidazolonepropionase-like amidohydrolase